MPEVIEVTDTIESSAKELNVKVHLQVIAGLEHIMYARVETDNVDALSHLFGHCPLPIRNQSYANRALTGYDKANQGEVGAAEINQMQRQISLENAGKEKHQEKTRQQDRTGLISCPEDSLNSRVREPTIPESRSVLKRK